MKKKRHSGKMVWLGFHVSKPLFNSVTFLGRN